mmetsp:Transcript_53343/g.84818  ORF Transcript_53343/g.84818 Transcript_53343/m.84818 type:complete len:108 (+) Transcript_53343:394-717(+)
MAVLAPLASSLETLSKDGAQFNGPLATAMGIGSAMPVSTICVLQDEACILHHERIPADLTHHLHYTLAKLSQKDQEQLYRRLLCDPASKFKEAQTGNGEIKMVALEA